VCAHHQCLFPQDTTDTAGLCLPAGEESIEWFSEQAGKRNAVMFDPQPTGELFCWMDRFFTVAGNTLIDRYGNEPDVLPCREETVQKEKECGAVFATAQGNCYTILRDDQLPGFYGICHSQFHISSKMGPAKMTVVISLAYDCRFRAERTFWNIRLHCFCFQASTPVCYPDNTNLITPLNNRILRKQLPVPGYYHFKRIYTLLEQDLFNRGRTMLKNPDVLVR
jgi:hypothetical protein